MNCERQVPLSGSLCNVIYFTLNANQNSKKNLKVSKKQTLIITTEKRYDLDQAESEI